VKGQVVAQVLGLSNDFQHRDPLFFSQGETPLHNMPCGEGVDFSKVNESWLSMVVHTCNPRTPEGEMGGS
jgi:hypothetical protein